MHLRVMPNGGFLIDGEDLGPVLGLDLPEVPRPMREGQITSRPEHGEDEGRFRLTFWYGQTRVRLVVLHDGTVIGQSRVSGAPPR